MAEKYPLSRTITGRERDILSQKKIGDARLGYATDTNKLMFFEGTKWVGAESQGVTQFSSSSSGSSQSSSSSSLSSSSSMSSSMSSSSMSSSSMSSSSMSSSSISSSSSQDREIYPVIPAMVQQVTPDVDSSNVDIYTVINIEANISQVFNMDIGVFEVELVGLFVYTGGLSDLTTQGQYIPLEGSYAFSVASTGVEPEFLMSLATKFITSLETEKKVITIADKDYQRIIFERPDQAHVLDTYTLNASASSGLDVTFTSSDTSIATVSNNTVTFLEGGEVEITASQAGDADYEAAEDVTHKLIIKPRIIIQQDVKTGTGNTGLGVRTPIHAYTNYTISYWIRPTLGPTASDYDVYMHESKHSTYHRLYGDGSGYIAGSGHRPYGTGLFDTGSNRVGTAYEAVYLNPDGWTPYIRPGTYTSGEWHHVAWVRSLNDASVAHYVNGVKIATYLGSLYFDGFSDSKYNGTYTSIALGQSHTKYTTDDVNGTPTWKSTHMPEADPNDLRINGKPFYLRRLSNAEATAEGLAPSSNGTYNAYAAIFWDDVNERWVLTDSPALGISNTLPTQIPINEVNATKIMYTDTLALGFQTGTNGWLSEDSGVTKSPGGAGEAFAQISSNLPTTGYTTDSELRAAVKDENDLISVSNYGIYFGGGYSTNAVTYPRDITEIAIWKDTFLTDTEIQTLYNEGHSNYSGPSFAGLNPNIMNIQGGPVAYYRGGMDDFLMSGSVKNVGSTPQSHHVVAETGELGANANLIKYEP